MDDFIGFHLSYITATVIWQEEFEGTRCLTAFDITDIQLKVSTLNDFYSTNILFVYPAAKHILSLGIDARLKAGNVTLVITSAIK